MNRSVGYRCFGSFVDFDKRFQGVDPALQEKILSFKHVSAEELKSMEVPEGEVKLLSTGLYDGYTTEQIAADFLNEGEVVTIPSGGAPNIKYYNGKFVDSGNILCSAKDDGVCLKYVYYGLRANKHLLETNVKGASIKHPQMAEIWRIKMPDIPVGDQQLVVDELDSISSVITNKQLQVIELDRLAQAIFHDMFGTPEGNEKGFDVEVMDDVVLYQGGSQPDKKYFEYEPSDDNIRLIQIRDYKTDKYVTYIPKSLARRFCSADDIMIGRYGPPIFQVLKGLEGAYNVALMKAIPKKGEREFIRYFLKQDCLRQYLENFSKRVAGQDGIQMDKLKAYPFPYPPEDLQKEFVHKVTEIDEQKGLIQRSIEEFENLLTQRIEFHFA